MGDTNSSQTIRIARCEVAGRLFGLDLSAIVGIQPCEVVRFEATDSEMVVGTIASLGQRLPVYSLAQLLGLPNSRTHAGHCIVATDGIDVWGLLADRVSHSESRTASEVVPLPALITGSSASMIQGVICEMGDEGLPMIVLDLKRLRPRPQEVTVAGDVAIRPMSASVDLPASGLNVVHRQLIAFSPAAADEADNVRYAFSVRQVSEIIRIPNSVPLPGSPDSVVGLTVWRKGPLPIVRFASSRKRSDRPADSTDRVAVVRVPECELPLGLLVKPECEQLSCPLPGTPVSAGSIGQQEQQIRAAFQVGSQTLLFPRFTVNGGLA